LWPPAFDEWIAIPRNGLVSTGEVVIDWLTRGSLARQRRIAFFVFLLPWMLGFVLWTAGPMLASLGLSLTTYDAIAPPHFVGLQNYASMFSSMLTWQSLKATSIYTFGAVGVTVIASLLLATLLNQRLPLLSVWRTVYYLPVVTSGVAVSLLWWWIFQPDYGLVNSMLWSLLHIHGPAWFFSVHWVLPAFIIMALWGLGGPMLIYLAAMQGVPTQLYDAASIDGAGWWRRYFHITLPMISPAILFNAVLSVIGSFQVFTPAYVITQGGPNYASYFYVFNIYEQAFVNFRFGEASALAWLLFVIILVVTIVILRTSSVWVYYEEGGGRI
jgi:multiple sugar transport system permease protein